MAHCQAPALPQSKKGKVMKYSQLDCSLEVMSQGVAKVRMLFKKGLPVFVAGCLTISSTINLQIRTGEGLVN